MKLLKFFLLITSLFCFTASCGDTHSNLKEVSNPPLSYGEASRVSAAVANSAQALQQALTMTAPAPYSGKVIPEQLIRQSLCIVVLKVHRGAILLGGNGGEGLMSCRTATGEFSAPSFLRTGGFELSAGIGYKQLNIVYFITNPAVAENFKNQGQFSLRPYANAVAANASIAIRNASQYGVAAVQLNDLGLYAGVGISLSSLSHMTGLRNQKVYAQVLGNNNPNTVPMDASGRECSWFRLASRRNACIRQWQARSGGVISVESILTLPAYMAPTITQPWNDVLRHW